MKKILSLLALMMLCIVGANAETVAKYTIGAKLAGLVNMDLTLAENTALPYTATFADCYRSATGGDPVPGIQIQNADITSGTNVTLGTLNGWDTTFTISEEGTSVISLTLNVGELTITVNVSETKTFSLVPGPWDVDGARFAAWTWSNDNDGQWIDFTKVGETYTISIPAANTGLVLVRMNGETTENNWDNKWNQTGDIDITNVPNNSVFTITGWGESDYTISSAASPLDLAKAALQAAIDKAKAFNTTGLADIIAAAQAAVDDENATIESIQAAAATFEAGVKTYLKYVLTTAIPMLESLNAEALTNAINSAKAALANEDATAAELAEALLGMIEPARPYIVGILQQTVDVCKPLGIDTSAAEAALSEGDAASTVGLALTLYNLTQAAIPAIQGVVTNLKAYMTTFSNGAAEALAEDFAKLESDIANGNIAAVKNDIVTLMTNGKPYLQADIEKLEGYAEVLNSADITADVAAMKAAVEAGSFANLLAAVEQFKAHFLAAAPDFVAQVKFAAAGFKDAGKTNAMEQLEDAITAAEQALAAEDATIVTVGLAIRNLIVAVQTHLAANSTYTIAGTKDLTGTDNDWDVVEANNMTKSAEDYMYEWTAEDITVNAENQPQFKVVITDIEGNQTWIPASEEGNNHNWIITPDVVGGEGVYTITITYNAKTQDIDVTGVKNIEFPENAIVYDFKAAAAAGENPANKNGSAANGQAFYGWENAEKTDSKRQDYKGYEWAEGSVLPEECHIWRRSDRINGNVAGNGGLKCPSNKEMAIDGLKAGDKVIIVYDAENATDKEIIWAIGDGSSDETLEGPRATATINGVEAVTGETTIASGAEIVINSVTPAENGSGYIVFQVKKGMVIKQIAIVSMNAEWAEAIAAAQALAEEDGVAVGKLLAAIDEAKGISEPTDEQKAALQNAVDQYKLDNADQEKDETAKVATNGWKKFDGTAAGVCATQFAPAITTYDGRTAQLAEVYEEGETAINRTGTIIYQDITGLANGKYKVGFYGNAFFTSGRGFNSPMEDGAEDVAYVFANNQKEFIVSKIATSTTENNFRSFDVEVTDGNIKLGMGKEKPGTNWHTMQIYQLTWFTTAKEIYAADQAELAEVIAEGKALLADESKTNGRDLFKAVFDSAEQSVGSNMLNCTEIENVIANLKDAIAQFKKMNWYIDFAAGEYYVIDAESGLKMAAGHDWGTRGIVNEAGLDLTLTPYEESRTVTFDSRVSNGGNSHFLGSNLYMDSSEWGWALEYQGFGFYIVEPNSGKYINIDNNFNLVLSDTPAEWIIVSKDGVRAQLLEEMAAATTENPVDATGLIVAPNFNRNDARNAEAWSVSEDCTNKNLSGGNNINNCAESYHSPFTIMQTISDCPAGLYQMTAQGFYRQDGVPEGEETPAAPVFFANGVNGDVPVLAEGGPNGMSTASEAFTNGDYTINPITFEVKDDGMMYIGITASTNTQWVIWDNFQLKYFGNVSTGIATVNTTVEQNNNGIYNLAGQRVVKAQKGLYIINGKKVVK